MTYYDLLEWNRNSYKEMRNSKLSRCYYFMKGGETPMGCNVQGISNVQSISACPQLPGTLLRVNIPAGAVINVLNLIELASPSGICLIIRLPILGTLFGGTGMDLSGITNAIRMAGGTVEVVNN